jgi:hypothetical protein
VLGLFVGWWLGWLIWAVWSTSARISRLAARVASVDLLDMSAWSPFVKQGLLTALLTVGGLSICSLMLLEPRQWPAVAIWVVVCLPLALLGLLLPLRGAHQRILQVKEVELEWARGRIRQSRALLGGALSEVSEDTPDTAPSDASSETSPGQMSDLIAYLQLIDDVPEWPVQASALLQVTLYLLIPIVSWFGGLLIESLLDQLFG